MFKSIILIFFIFTNIWAYESENKLKVIIVGKIAKYITFNDSDDKSFIITVLSHKDENIFNKIYKNKTIKSKPVKIIYKKNIKSLKHTNILYIPQVNSKTLSTILSTIDGKNILTVSATKGFAQRGGMIQLYFVAQNLKLKINTHKANKVGIKIAPLLLRISKVVEDQS